MIEIVNVSNGWAIGKKGDLLVTIPEDMKFFRTTTRGHVCIMGSTTLESFPRMAPLKDRVNIVLIDDDSRIRPESLAALEADRAAGRTTELKFVHSPQEAVDLAATYGDPETYVIGGATIYRIMLPWCDTCLVTHNDLTIKDADVYYPDLTATGEWQLATEGEEHTWHDDQGDRDIHYRFCTYKRVK